MVYPVWAAGTKVTAAKLTAMQGVYVVKAADSTNATTTMADASDLSFTALANATYLIQARFSYDASATTTDIKIAWADSSGLASMQRNILSANSASTDDQTATMNAIRRGLATQQVGGTATGSQFWTWWEDVILTMGAADGTIKVQFAANAAGTATFRGASYFIYQRL